MFGLTFEKLLLIAVVAVVIVGPARLPGYAKYLAQFVKGLRSLIDGAKERVKDEMGPEFDEVDWKTLDPRQYDPRKIIREALKDDPKPVAVSTEPDPTVGQRWSSGPDPELVAKAKAKAEAEALAAAAESEAAKSFSDESVPEESGAEVIDIANPAKAPKAAKASTTSSPSPKADRLEKTG